MGNKIKTLIKYIIFSMIDILTINKKTNNRDDKILLIRIDAIGDSIIWMDSAKEYKKMYPKKKIVLVCNSIWKDIAEITGYFDEVIPLEIKRFNKDLIYRYKFFKEVKKTKYKKIISPVYSRTFFVVDWLVKNIVADEKIGSVGDCSNIPFKQKKISDKWYTKLIEADSKEMFELERNAEFIRNLFKKKYCASFSSIEFDYQKYSSRVLENKKYCVIFLGASTLKRVYPVKKIVEVLKEIPVEMAIVLCGSNEEKELSEEFQENFNRKNKIIDLVGETNLIESLAFIKGAKFLIGNETASVHMAVAVKTPSICILGGGHFGRFMPYKLNKKLTEEERRILPKVVYKKMECYNCNWQCRYPLINDITWKCIYEIEVDDIKNKIFEIIKENRN